VLFSSHVLSDAEALCSQVAILAKGRLVAAGSLDELTGLTANGWELVVSGLSSDTLERVRSSIASATRVGDARFALVLPSSTRPERLIAELTACGARIVSLNPLRGTLEDYFVERVRSATEQRELRTGTS
jgi:ABC-2 type transport system ATP-binding protein